MECIVNNVRISLCYHHTGLPPTPILEKKSLRKGALSLVWSSEDDDRNPIQGIMINFKSSKDYKYLLP